ncbi:MULTISPECIES: HrpB1 family type III secretion system apparatus protein [unclassified Duganella]|uniref:HrpB1 family type III secretion system apparatus protein n=1 Tax=unclassified Duganella TaxID=2636909 RepID=UPI001314C286|nr:MULTISPECIES: HrpB1 family type III secretion system apparatus protein [unclassified Duganella]
MDYTSCDKKIVSSLIEVLLAGVKNDCLAESDALLAALRVLRPRFRELDTFDAWLLMKRKKYLQATHILRNLDGATPGIAAMPISTALLAVCLFAANDPAWSISANEVLVRNEDPEAIALVNMLFGKHPEPQDEPEPAPPAPAEPGYSHYLRA